MFGLARPVVICPISKLYPFRHSLMCHCKFAKE